VDPRTRRNRTNLRNEGFKRQIEGIVDAYIGWQETNGEDGLDAGHPSLPAELCQGIYPLNVVDVFCECFLVITLQFLSITS
jgi:hypothetical protein